MTRLAAIVARHPSPFSPRPYPPARAVAFAPLAPSAEPDDMMADLKLFATGWLGGLVFFGTFLA